MRFALGSLAVVAPDWLFSEVDAQWVERYGHRIEESRLPKSEGDRLALSPTNWSRRPKASDRRLRFAESRLAAGDSCSPGLAPALSSKTTSLRMSNSGGEKAKIFPRYPVHQLALRDSKLTGAKSARPCGPGIKSISLKRGSADPTSLNHACDHHPCAKDR